MRNKTDEVRCTKIRWTNEMNWMKLKRMNKIRWSDEIGLLDGRTNGRFSINKRKH